MKKVALMKSIKVLLFASVSVLAISACGSSGGGAEPVKSATESTERVSIPSDEKLSFVDSDPKIIVHDLAVSPGMTVSGRLTYSADSKCLVVNGERAEEAFTATPVWPKGVEPVLNGGKRGVRVPGFGTVLEGDTVHAGGSYWKADDERARDSGIDPACRAEDGFIVFSAGSFTK
ncbi:hypothetical protein [Streptomyces sp. WAC04114]|uniref:hypothetical protein n=1 Tax=Streptomyces sp. WAC04114 TaxID=2867961 RepID=UPI001C8C9E9F|nr:hypothetical protein [Streptomyces sp. WAC04114]MBX9362895.1 hypothetical protein [Streptomyces sp. WAC04114]